MRLDRENGRPVASESRHQRGYASVRANVDDRAARCDSCSNTKAPPADVLPTASASKQWSLCRPTIRKPTAPTCTTSSPLALDQSLNSEPTIGADREDDSPAPNRVGPWHLADVRCCAGNFSEALSPTL